MCISSSASHSEDLQAAARHLDSVGLVLSESADPLSSSIQFLKQRYSFVGIAYITFSYLVCAAAPSRPSDCSSSGRLTACH